MHDAELVEPKAAGWRPTAADLEAARGRAIPDVVGPGLRILFVGINPGLWSGAMGRHFARPGNRFWPALFGAGLTSRLLAAHDSGELLRAGIGITNLVNRATAAASELDAAEIRAGGRRLERLVEEIRPGLVAVLGISAYRAAFDRPHARLGRQSEDLAGAQLWVLPNPSGLNAHYQLPALIDQFAALREATT